MPKGNIAALRALKLAKKEANRIGNQEKALHMIASRSNTSPLDLSEPHANTNLLDIPCTPVTTTTTAAAEAFETPAATLTEAGAVELPPSADNEAEDDEDKPKRARKSSVIMNVSEFPTNFKRKKDAEVAASTETLGNAIYNEKLLVEGIQQLREGCPGCKKHTAIDFVESVTQGVGGSLRFKCTNKACGHETQINKSKMMPGLNPAGKPTRPKSENTLRTVVAAKTAGMGHTQCNHFFLAMNMKPINTTV